MLCRSIYFINKTTRSKIKLISDWMNFSREIICFKDGHWWHERQNILVRNMKKNPFKCENWKNFYNALLTHVHHKLINAIISFNRDQHVLRMHWKRLLYNWSLTQYHCAWHGAQTLTLLTNENIVQYSPCKTFRYSPYGS